MSHSGPVHQIHAGFAPTGEGNWPPMTASSSDQVDVNGPEPDLKRVMGPKLLLLFIVGDILGAGVYAVTGRLAGQVGGVA